MRLELTLTRIYTSVFHTVSVVKKSFVPEEVIEAKGRFQIEKKKKSVTLLQPSSVYLPTPIIVQKVILLIFFTCSKMSYKIICEEKNFFPLYSVQPKNLEKFKDFS